MRTGASRHTLLPTQAEGRGVGAAAAASVEAGSKAWRRGRGRHAVTVAVPERASLLAAPRVRSGVLGVSRRRVEMLVGGLGQ